MKKLKTLDSNFLFTKLTPSNIFFPKERCWTKKQPLRRNFDWNSL